MSYTDALTDTYYIGDIDNVSTWDMSTGIVTIYDFRIYKGSFL